MHHKVCPTSSSRINSCTPLNCYTGHCVLPRRPSPYASLNVEQMNEKIVRCAFIFPWFVACICEHQLTAFSSCNRENSVLKSISGAGNLQGLYAWGACADWPANVGTSVVSLPAGRGPQYGNGCQGMGAVGGAASCTPGIGGANGKLAVASRPCGHRGVCQRRYLTGASLVPTSQRALPKKKKKTVSDKVFVKCCN